MKRRPDPTLEALRRANPFPEAPERPAEVARLRSSARRSHRRRILVVAIVGAAVAFAVAGAFSLGPMKTETPNLVACHNQLLQESSFAVVGLLGREPVEACRQEWQHAFQEPAPPRLAACVIREGANAVFPYPEGMTSAEACSSVDAAVPDRAGP